MPLVTVVIPNFNHASYLPKRIESVLNQSFIDIELILLDDCSNDNSRAIMARYAEQDARVSLLFNEANSGNTFKQWDKGLKIAKGKYLWIAESDDFAECSFLAELVPLLESQDDIVLAYANSNIVDEGGHVCGTTAEWKNELYNTTHWGNDFIVDGKKELDSYLSKTCTINNASAVLFRTANLAQQNIIDISFRYTGDWLVYIKLAMLGKIAYKAACLSNYRDHASNSSKKSFDNGAQLFERQKCFAFAYKSKVLGRAALQEMTALASAEFVALIYNLLKRSWRPQLLGRYIKEIAKVSIRFYMLIQKNALKSILKREY